MVVGVDADARFDRELARLRRWSVAWFSVWAGAIPAVTFIGAPLSQAFGTSAPDVVLGIGAMAFFAYSAIRVGLFRCPRCGERYTSKSVRGLLVYRNPFTPACLHCGLRRR